MKRLLFITGLLLAIIIIPVKAQSKKEIRFEKEFQKTLALVNSDKFIVKFYIATPTVETLFTPPGAGNNIDIEPKNSYLWVKDSLVGVKIPYFGSGAVKSGSQLDSISFQNILFSRTVKVYWQEKSDSVPAYRYVRRERVLLEHARSIRRNLLSLSQRPKTLPDQLCRSDSKKGLTNTTTYSYSPRPRSQFTPSI